MLGPFFVLGLCALSNLAIILKLGNRSWLLYLNQFCCGCLCLCLLHCAMPVNVAFPGNTHLSSDV